MGRGEWAVPARRAAGTSPRGRASQARVAAAAAEHARQGGKAAATCAGGLVGPVRRAAIGRAGEETLRARRVGGVAHGSLVVRLLRLAPLLLLCACPLTVRIEEHAGPEPAAVEPARKLCENEIPGACATEMLLASVVQYMTFFAELCGALVIATAVLRALARFVPHLRRRASPHDAYQDEIRLQLGKSLALALEFELAADILKTAVVPSLAVIGQLAAIVVLRTLLNYFLERELRQAESRGAGREHPRERAG